MDHKYLLKVYSRLQLHLQSSHKASDFNIRSLIHIVILQSLGDTTFFKKALQTDRHTDKHTHRHRAYKWLQVLPFNLTVNVGNDNYYRIYHILLRLGSLPELVRSPLFEIVFCYRLLKELKVKYYINDYIFIYNTYLYYFINISA